MATIKVAPHVRKVKGKTIKVSGFSRTIKTSGKSRKKPLTAQQKKKQHNWYQKNRTKIAQKRKLKH